MILSLIRHLNACTFFVFLFFLTQDVLQTIYCVASDQTQHVFSPNASNHLAFGNTRDSKTALPTFKKRREQTKFAE